MPQESSGLKELSRDERTENFWKESSIWEGHCFRHWKVFRSNPIIFDNKSKCYAFS